MATATPIRRERLVELWKQFVDGFNRGDLESVMSMFSDSAVVENFDGQRNSGKREIRASLEPYFQGEMHFVDEDLVADTEMSRLTAPWRVTIKNKGVSSVFRGVDVLQFANDKIVLNKVYIKAKEPVLET